MFFCSLFLVCFFFFLQLSPLLQRRKSYKQKVQRLTDWKTGQYTVNSQATNNTLLKRIVDYPVFLIYIHFFFNSNIYAETILYKDLWTWAHNLNIYNSLRFTFCVCFFQSINKAMEKDHEEYNIGVLDIYGFEIFQVRQCTVQGLSRSDLREFFIYRGKNPKHERQTMARVKGKKKPALSSPC